MEFDDLDRKLTAVFPGKVVRKDLLHQIKGGENVPSYVLEYLLGKYCASDDPEEIRLGHRGRQGDPAPPTTSATTRPTRPSRWSSSRAGTASSTASRSGTCPARTSTGPRWTTSASSGSTSREEFYRRYDRLLEGGIWAQVDVEFRADEETGKGTARSTSPTCKPIQLARFDFERVLRMGAAQFSDGRMDRRAGPQHRATRPSGSTPA